jgi:hypothetical protein
MFVTIIFSKNRCIDLGVGLVLTLWFRPKEVMKKINAGSLIRKRSSGDWQNRNPDHRTDKLGVYQNSLTSEHSLYDQSTIIILSDDHMAIKFSYQSGKGLAGTIGKVLLVVLQEHLSNREQNGVSRIYAEKISLR